MPLEERLARAAASRAALAAAADELVGLAVSEAGIPRRFARREVASAVGFLDALPVFADAIRPRPVPAAGGRTVLEWRPFGVVAGWHAANSPVWVPTLVVVSALVAGNAAVSRPSRRVARTTARVLEVLAGEWPADAVLAAHLDPPEAEALITHPGVHAVVAHASTVTCRRHLAALARAYADGVPLRPYIPEASGNDAFIVLPGADLSRAAEAAALGAFANAGQLCMSAKRLIVHADVWPAFLPLLEDRVGRLVVGDPAGEETDIGPGLPGAAYVHARAALHEALGAGGAVVVGGDDGDAAAPMSPTIVMLPRDRLDGLVMWREEVFAPLRAVVLCRDAAEALALANDTPFGLGAAVFGGGGAERALLVAGLRAARVVVDEGPMYQDPHLVVGGVGDSGIFGARPKLEQLVWARRVHHAGV